MRYIDLFDNNKKGESCDNVNGRNLKTSFYLFITLVTSISIHLCLAILPLQADDEPSSPTPENEQIDLCSCYYPPER
jgi:hypothetical protein